MTSEFDCIRPAATSGRRRQLLNGYLLNMGRGVIAVREMIVDDIRRFSELGASAYAAELAEVLSCFDASHPRAT